MARDESFQSQRLRAWKVKPLPCRKSSGSSGKAWIQRAGFSGASVPMAFGRGSPSDSNNTECSYRRFSRRRLKDVNFYHHISVLPLPDIRAFFTCLAEVRRPVFARQVKK